MGWAFSRQNSQVGKDGLFVARPTMGIEEYLTEPRQLLASSVLVPAKQKDKFLAATDLLIATIKQYWHTDWQPLRLHGDCHPGNILWRDGPMFVDLMMPEMVQRFRTCGCYYTASAESN